MSRMLKVQDEARQMRSKYGFLLKHKNAEAGQPQEQSAANGSQEASSITNNAEINIDLEDTGRKSAKQSTTLQFSGTLMLLVALLALSSVILNLKLLEEMQHNRDSFLLFAGNVHVQEMKVDSLEKLLTDSNTLHKDQFQDLKTYLYELNTTIKNNESTIQKQSLQIEELNSDINGISQALKSSEAKISELSQNTSLLESFVNDLKMSGNEKNIKEQK